MRKPSLTLRCVADHYAINGQRIAEFSFPEASDGKGSLPGGLLSLQYREGAAPLVSIYRTEGCEVTGPGLEQFAWTIEGEHFDVPNHRYSVHRTEAGAKAKAAALINELVTDAKFDRDPESHIAGMTAVATPETWEAVQEELWRRRYADEMHADAWDDVLEDFEGANPGCGVFIMKIPVEV